MQAEHDIAACEWCQGDGKDHATLGMPVVRDCPRCDGSRRGYMTNRDSTTGRRRVYKGPAPKPGLTASAQQQQLTEIVKRTKRTRKKKRRAKRQAGLRAVVTAMRPAYSVTGAK